MATALSGRDIVIITRSRWNEPHRARYYLARELARHNRVLFVEVTETVRESPGQVLRHLRALMAKDRAERIGDNLFLYRPPPILPGGDWIWRINRFNGRMSSAHVRRVATNLGMRCPILWIFAFTAAGYLGRFDEQLSLYYCNDLFARHPEGSRRQAGLRRIEQALVRNVDLAFGVSPALVDDLKRENPNASLSPLGVDVEQYAAALRDDVPVPEDIACLPGPRVGYMGGLNYRIDVELVEAVARARPDWSLVFVGPIEGSRADVRQRLADLDQLDNVFHLGNKPQSTLAGYLKGFDVCVVPYRAVAPTRYIFANAKLFQYFAGGKPVVYSNLPHVTREYTPDLMKIAKPGVRSFISCVEACLAQKDPELVRRRVEVARSNTWEQRVQEMSAIIEKHLTAHKLRIMVGNDEAGGAESD